ncbi:MAG: endolytic transglycosylase MltG [bacterium JZ-2024 1]
MTSPESPVSVPDSQQDLLGELLTWQGLSFPLKRIGLLILGIAFSWLFFIFEGGLSAPVATTIQPGDTGKSVAEMLYDKGVLRHPALLQVVSRLGRNDLRNLQPGTYMFPGLLPLRAVQDALSRHPVPISITIPEGSTASQIADLLQSEGVLQSASFLRAVHEAEYPGMDRPQTGWEGYLFPDTYEFPEGLNSTAILHRLISRFFSHLPKNWMQLTTQKKLSLHDVVIVASMVQREALLDEEMPLIASVIYNRLKKKMPLQIDATVAYALNKWGQRITYEDLKVDHPYNTYLRMGLPPGPIGNPGRQALLSALFPAKTDFLFFVADGTGAHRFSRSYFEHRANVDLERRRRARISEDLNPVASAVTVPANSSP